MSLSTSEFVDALLQNDSAFVANFVDDWMVNPPKQKDLFIDALTILYNRRGVTPSQEAIAKASPRVKSWLGEVPPHAPPAGVLAPAPAAAPALPALLSAAGYSPALLPATRYSHAATHSATHSPATVSLPGVAALGGAPAPFAAAGPPAPFAGLATVAPPAGFAAGPFAGFAAARPAPAGVGARRSLFTASPLTVATNPNPADDLLSQIMTQIKNQDALIANLLDRVLKVESVLEQYTGVDLNSNGKRPHHH